jgi:MFS family permease
VLVAFVSMASTKDETAVSKQGGYSTEDTDVEKEIGLQRKPSSDEVTVPDLKEKDLENGGAKEEAEPGIDDLESPLSRTITSDPNSRPACFKSTLHEIMFVLTATLAIAQSSILIGVTSAITSYIAADLHMTQSQVTWITASTSLSAGAFLMFFGSVADQFGRRWMLIGSMGLFSLFALVTGFSTGPIYIDVMGAMMGLCSAAAVPPAIGILGSVYKRPSKRKNMAFACFSAGNPLGFVVGVFISGVCYKVATWRTSFWVLAVLYAGFTVAAFWSVPADQGVRGKFNVETLKKFDYIGVLLASSGIALFTSALTLVFVFFSSAEGFRLIS